MNQYLLQLEKSSNWIEYLKTNSGLPGKRANLELLKTVITLGDEAFFLSCLKFTTSIAPTDTPEEFVAMCGVTGLGKLITNGNYQYFDLLKEYASDCRWRVREGVAMALQLIGEAHFDCLIQSLQEWINGNEYEKRAVVAGLCEPRLLKAPSQAKLTLIALNEITASISFIIDRKRESFRVLKNGLAYGWSVAIAASPELGKELFELHLQNSDKDIQWILRENIKKKRLEKMDTIWVNNIKMRLSELSQLKS